MEMSFMTKVILFIIVLHLVVGFGWVMFKLSPKKGDKLITHEVDEEGPEKDDDTAGKE